MQVRFLSGLPNRKGREFLGLSFLKPCSNSIKTRLVVITGGLKRAIPDDQIFVNDYALGINFPWSSITIP
jgi:hypothetical protein